MPSGSKNKQSASSRDEGTMFVEDSGSRVDATIGPSLVAEGQGPATLPSESEQHIRDIVDKITSRNLNHGGGRKATGGAWLLEEDKVLRAIVVRDGEGVWKGKARELNSSMAPLHQKLTLKAIAQGESPVVYGRNAAQCLHRWKKVLEPGVMKGHWTPSEDAALVDAVQSAMALPESMKWSKIASYIPGRMGKQCRERWFNHLSPTLKKAPWTSEEEDVLFHAQKFFGPRWCEISRCVFPGRTANDIKNRFNSSARGRWLKSGNAEISMQASDLFVQRLKTSAKNLDDAKQSKRKYAATHKDPRVQSSRISSSVSSERPKKRAKHHPVSAKAARVRSCATSSTVSFERQKKRGKHNHTNGPGITVTQSDTSIHWKKAFLRLWLMEKRFALHGFLPGARR
ncbi:unnamed protein product [Ectocarpus sp. 12 AP-2014]